MINLFVFTFLISNVYCELADIRSILTQNESLNFLHTIYGPKRNKSPYCSICCIDISSETIGKNCGSHTLCKYQRNKRGPSCKGYIKVSFTDEEKKAILDAHNTIRNNVAGGWISPQPPASNMRALGWSQELEEIADTWAAQCIYNNDECRDLKKYPVGQNIAQGDFAMANELNFIKSWFDEAVYFNITNIDAFKIPGRGKLRSRKYSQLVWGDTHELGCARAVFQETKQNGVVYRENFICNYGPSGNIPKLPVYRTGPPCSRCPEGLACGTNYPYLCEANSITELKIGENGEIWKSNTGTHVHLYIFYLVFILNIYFL